MHRGPIVAMSLMLSVSSVSAASTVAELDQQVQQLMQQLQALQEEVQRQRTAQDHLHGTAATVEPHAQEADSNFVDLSLRENTAVAHDQGTHVLENPWWRNLNISGFAASGYYDTGSAGTRDNGGFEIKEATLFVEAEVWEDVGFFAELQTNRLGKDDEKFVRTGEVYAHFRDIPLTESLTFGMKIGRFDIPFGDEYLWQDAIDNPLITNSAAYPYGWDEGVLIYGDVRGVGWIAAVTDGTDSRSKEENSDKAINLKVYGNPLPALDLSLSLMTTGDVSKSAIEFGGSHFRPVGAAHQSSLGASAGADVDARLMELSAKYNFVWPTVTGHLALSFGAAATGDDDPIFDRDFRWFSIEPSVHLNKIWHTTLRYSEIGTYDSGEGYHFDGKTFAGGNTAFGYDARRFQRLALGLGWTPNPHLRGKLEIGKDRFDLIDASVLTGDTDGRHFIGAEIAVGF